MYRQGDITLKPINKLPNDCHASFDGNVIAYGEESGHRHWIDAPNTIVFEDLDGNVFVEIKEETVLLHTGPDMTPPHSIQEAREKDLHLPIEIEKGVYQISIETDYDPYRDIKSIAKD